mgnify:CR=1 FL=1
MTWDREWGEWWMQTGWPQPGPYPLFDEFDFAEEGLEEQVEGVLELSLIHI